MSRTMRSLSRSDVHLIQESFSALSAHPAKLAARFYAHLFRIDPTLRRLFHGGMIEQGKKFVDMLALVAARLDQIDALLPMIRELGARHVGYRVEEAHYATARAALLAAFDDILRDPMSSATRTAWGRAYDLLAETMIEAARGADPVSPGPT